jgi:RNA polymerase sigma-70 factor (ECF subfamily)
MSQPSFLPETHWSVIHRLGSEDSASRERALEEICRTYWQPLYALARSWGRSPHDAEDLTQSFFAGFCERGGLGKASQERGRFRNLLIASFRNYLTDTIRHEQALRRGGAIESIPLDFAAAEIDFQRALAVEPDASRLVDRAWALAVVEHALAACRSEWVRRGKAEEFNSLEPVLTPHPQAPSYAELGQRLGLTEDAIATKVKRLRAWVGEQLRKTVADTVSHPDEVRGELSYLMSLL